MTNKEELSILLVLPIFDYCLKTCKVCRHAIKFKLGQEQGNKGNLASCHRIQ